MKKVKITAKSGEIELAMAKAGLTGKKLSEATKIDQSYLISMFRGQRHPLPTTAKRIADALGVATEQIFTYEIDGEYVRPEQVGGVQVVCDDE